MGGCYCGLGGQVAGGDVVLRAGDGVGGVGGGVLDGFVGTGHPGIGGFERVVGGGQGVSGGLVVVCCGLDCVCCFGCGVRHGLGGCFFVFQCVDLANQGFGGLVVCGDQVGFKGELALCGGALQHCQFLRPRCGNADLFFYVISDGFGCCRFAGGVFFGQRGKVGHRYLQALPLGKLFGGDTAIQGRNKISFERLGGGAHGHKGLVYVGLQYRHWLARLKQGVTHLFE